jgi:hypothetical protein
MNRFFQSEDGNLFAIEQIKNNLLVLVNADLKASLSKTDWQVIRANDSTSQKNISNEILSERQSARDLAIFLENEISKADTIEQLEEIYKQYL